MHFTSTGKSGKWMHSCGPWTRWAASIFPEGTSARPTEDEKWQEGSGDERSRQDDDCRTAGLEKQQMGERRRSSTWILAKLIWARAARVTWAAAGFRWILASSHDNWHQRCLSCGCRVFLLLKQAVAFGCCRSDLENHIRGKIWRINVFYDAISACLSSRGASWLAPRHLVLLRPGSNLFSRGACGSGLPSSIVSSPSIKVKAAVGEVGVATASGGRGQGSMVGCQISVDLTVWSCDPVSSYPPGSAPSLSLLWWNTSVASSY